jgi:tyrosyl-tRNA synthetase
MTTPYTLYQYWINTDDRDVGHFLKIFTFLTLEKISLLEQQQAERPGERAAQKRLAFELTRLIHGEATAKAVAAASEVLFGAGIRELTPDVLPHLAGAIPTVTIPTSTVDAGLPVVEALVISGAQPSRGAARRLIEQRGLYVNDERYTNIEGTLTRADALFGQAILLRSGKKYHLLLIK